MEIVSKILKSETVICIKYTNSAPDDDEAPANLVGGFDSEIFAFTPPNYGDFA